eukprot:6643245-Pyramimonas_sp.AAC.1
MGALKESNSLESQEGLEEELPYVTVSPSRKARFKPAARFVFPARDKEQVYLSAVDDVLPNRPESTEPRIGKLKVAYYPSPLQIHIPLHEAIIRSGLRDTGVAALNMGSALSFPERTVPALWVSLEDDSVWFPSYRTDYLEFYRIVCYASVNE